MKMHEKILLIVLLPIWMLLTFCTPGPVKHEVEHEQAKEIRKNIDTIEPFIFDPMNLDKCDNY